MNQQLATRVQEHRRLVEQEKRARKGVIDHFTNTIEVINNVLCKELGGVRLGDNKLPKELWWINHIRDEKANFSYTGKEFFVKTQVEDDDWFPQTHTEEHAIHKVFVAGSAGEVSKLTRKLIRQQKQTEMYQEVQRLEKMQSDLEAKAADSRKLLAAAKKKYNDITRRELEIN